MQNNEQNAQHLDNIGNAAKPIVSRRFKVGQVIQFKDHLPLRIMADVEGYYMARYKGCIPFCCSEKELIRRIERNGG